jgi:hypothetical protein
MSTSLYASYQADNRVPSGDRQVNRSSEGTITWHCRSIALHHYAKRTQFWEPTRAPTSGRPRSLSDFGPIDARPSSSLFISACRSRGGPVRFEAYLLTLNRLGYNLYPIVTGRIHPLSQDHLGSRLLENPKNQGMGGTVFSLGGKAQVMFTGPSRVRPSIHLKDRSRMGSRQDGQIIRAGLL